MEALLEKLQEFKRTAWLPVTEDRDGELTASKFSGKPWLAEGESWPKCDNCSKGMQLFVQLNFDQLPLELGGKFGSGLLQMFYCTNRNPFCEQEAKPFYPFAKSTLVRIVSPSPLNQASKIEIPSWRIIPNYFPAKVITDWIQKEDFPLADELESLGVHLSADEGEDLSDLNFPITGEKLGGWPFWPQNILYPICPICGEKMRMVFQIDSEDHLPYMFRDVGCGRITQCETHLDMVAFGWESC